MCVVSSAVSVPPIIKNQLGKLRTYSNRFFPECVTKAYYIKVIFFRGHKIRLHIYVINNFIRWVVAVLCMKNILWEKLLLFSFYTNTIHRPVS